MTEQTFILPWPPSANTMWRSHARFAGGGNYLSERYKKWKKAAGLELIAQGAKKITGPVRIVIGLDSPTKHVWDLDNRIKPVLDLLVEHLVIEEDHIGFVREITAHGPTGLVGAQVTITKVAA